MTIYSLHSLFHSVSTAPTEQSLRSRFMDGVSESFGVQRWGIYLLGDDNYAESIDVQGVSDDFVDRYQRFGKSIDPVLNYVMQYHAPAHEELVLPPGGWKRSDLYQKCCSEYNHEHIMTGAIVGNGQLIGTELWITQNSVKQALKRMFRKLEVSARTEMVAKLRDLF